MLVLFLKNLLFTLIVPGMIVVWLPLNWFERNVVWPKNLGVQHWVGLIFAGAGLLVYLLSIWQLMCRGRGTPAPIDPPKKLIQRGPYAWVRNPLYLAAISVVAGESIFLLSWHIAVYWIVLVCFFQLYVVLHEEHELDYRFGAMYGDYKNSVPRWLPRPPRNTDR